MTSSLQLQAHVADQVFLVLWFYFDIRHTISVGVCHPVTELNKCHGPTVFLKDAEVACILYIENIFFPVQEKKASSGAFQQ